MNYMTKEYYVIDVCAAVDELDLVDKWMTAHEMAALLNYVDNNGVELDMEVFERALHETRYLNGFAIENDLAFRPVDNINPKGSVTLPVYKIHQIKDMHAHSGDLRFSDDQRHIYHRKAQACIQKAANEIEIIQRAAYGKDRDLVEEFDTIIDKLCAIF